MKKILSGIAVMLAAVTLVGCGSHSSGDNASSSQAASSQVAKKSSVNKTSNSAITNKNTNSGSTTPNQVTKVDNKTAGVMLALLVEPNWFKDSLSQDQMYYGVHGVDDGTGDLDGYSYLTTDGDPTSYIHYKVAGNTVVYKQWVPGDSVADGHMVTKSVSLARLEKDYYVSQSQQSEVDGYANQLRPAPDHSSSNMKN